MRLRPAPIARDLTTLAILGAGLWAIVRAMTAIVTGGPL